jgi:titin
VTLRWNGVPNAWYIVEHRNVSAGQGWQSTETLSANTTWTHTYLTNGNVYEYQIRAKNMAGVSGPSNMASAKPMPPFPQPASDLVAEGGDAKVFLSWRASPTPNVMYWVEYRESGSSSWVRLPYPVYCCSLTVNYMANNKVYWFRVITANITGEAAPTPERGARPMPPVPAPPTNLVAWGVKGGAELRWSPSPTQTGLLWYRIWYRNATAGHGWTEAFWGTSGTSNLQQYLTPFHNYEFAVQAVTESGRSGFSNVATAQPWVPVHDPQPYRPRREGVPGPATGWLYIGNNTYAQYQAQRMELYWTVNDAGARMQHWRAVTDIYRTQYCDVFGCGPLSSWKPTPCGYPAPVWWNLLTRCDAASRVWFQYVTRPPGPFPQHPI